MDNPTKNEDRGLLVERRFSLTDFVVGLVFSAMSGALSGWWALTMEALEPYGALGAWWAFLIGATLAALLVCAVVWVRISLIDLRERSDGVSNTVQQKIVSFRELVSAYAEIEDGGTEGEKLAVERALSIWHKKFWYLKTDINPQLRLLGIPVEGLGYHNGEYFAHVHANHLITVLSVLKDQGIRRAAKCTQTLAEENKERHA